MKNHRSGHVEDAHLSDFHFDDQYNTFHRCVTLRAHGHDVLHTAFMCCDTITACSQIRYLDLHRASHYAAYTCSYGYATAPLGAGVVGDEERFQEQKGGELDILQLLMTCRSNGLPNVAHVRAP